MYPQFSANSFVGNATPQTKMNQNYNPSTDDSHPNTAMNFDEDELCRSSIISDVAPKASHGAEGNDLTDTMMTTIVYNGNDALNILFEAAQNEERDASSARGTLAADEVSTYLTLSPTSPAVSTGTNIPLNISNELLKT